MDGMCEVKLLDLLDPQMSLASVYSYKVLQITRPPLLAILQEPWCRITAALNADGETYQKCDKKRIIVLLSVG
jgi:hypothetical protein